MKNWGEFSKDILSLSCDSARKSTFNILAFYYIIKYLDYTYQSELVMSSRESNFILISVSLFYLGIISFLGSQTYLEMNPRNSKETIYTIPIAASLI